MKQKLTLILFLLLTFLFTTPGTAYASSTNSKAVYDLQKGGKQIFLILNEDGSYDEILIEQIDGNTRVSNGTYKVSYQASSWTAGFYIAISNNRITDAYSAFHTSTIGSISNAVLTKNSSTMATYSFIHKVAVLNFNTGVIATISNSNLEVTKK